MPREHAILSSYGGAVMLTLLVLGGFALAGPLWIVTAVNNEQFNPACALAMAFAVPVGAALGLAAGSGSKAGWGTLLMAWVVGCIVGVPAYFQIVTLSGAMNPLLLSGIGLSVIALGWWLVGTKGGPKPLPPRR